ncbi:putative rhamnosyl transferase [Litorisediminicola beolgyonensis]|uniref:Rhamnosyl transferase n=1 Tax=Litorisediminicola beolgyonensis TaxID=1173614 RepID=A0ABW3ZL35_9RHOB
MQVIGLCRFSYPAEGGFQVEHSSLEERKAYLYAPERMEERLRVFELMCLPAFEAQTDPDFTLVVLIGDSLPPRYLSRLMELTARMPQVQIAARPPGPHRAVCQSVLNEARRDPSAPCLQFRHDDDDAVSVEFVEQLRAAASDCASLVEKHRLVGFDWNRGWLARLDAGGIRAEEVQHPYWGVAQAMAVAGGVKHSIMNFGHERINRFMPTVTFQDPPMFLRGHNGFNDSRQKKHVQPVELPYLDAGGEAEFAARFNIDADAVREAHR